MNKETHAEFIKLYEKILNDSWGSDYDGYAEKIKEILDYDIKLELIKASIYDVSLTI